MRSTPRVTKHLFLALLIINCTSSVAFQANTPLIQRTRSLLSDSRSARLPSSSPPRSDTSLHGYEPNSSFWDGDDRRWSRRLRRRVFRFDGISTETPVRDGIVVTTVAAYIWQALNTLKHIRSQFPEYWSTQAWSMISDAVIDSRGTVGPLMKDFMFSPILGMRQPHRFLTSGFLHGGVLHLACNMYALRQLPDWLETGLGWPLFVTTYIVGVVAGNYFHSRAAMDQFLYCLGASGGVVALTGLMFISLGKMGNRQGTAEILRSMGGLFAIGAIIPSMSNASHIGGFLGGCVMGLLFSPGYGKSYSLRRKNSVTIDPAPRDYRQVMGFGVMPNERPPVPLWMFWAVALVIASSQPRLMSMPQLVWRGLSSPGSLVR